MCEGFISKSFESVFVFRGRWSGVTVLMEMRPELGPSATHFVMEPFQASYQKFTMTLANKLFFLRLNFQLYSDVPHRCTLVYNKVKTIQFKQSFYQNSWFMRKLFC